ncbi:MAG: ABC transporter permease [Synergistaceae bacterium]|nr:ABC transporter permease [Synergistaceae bacterium]NCU26416.1 ABC transporter permease [Candidatus Nomurabacteria bacterium]
MKNRGITTSKIKNNAPAIPVLVWVGFFAGVPLVFVLVISFLTRDSLGIIVLEFSTENYRRIFEPVYLKIFFNSFLLAGLTGVVTLVIGYPVAYITSKLKGRQRTLTIGLIMLPFWISSLLRTYGWRILLDYKGIINNILTGLGITNEPVTMLGTFAASLVGTAYMLIPFMIIAVFNSVDKLDRSLLEASYDLGAGKLKTFRNITLRLTLPGIAGGFTLVFIPALGLFFISDILGGGQTVYLGNKINELIGRGRNKPLAAAMSVAMVLFITLVIYIYTKVSKEEVGGLL